MGIYLHLRPESYLQLKELHRQSLSTLVPVSPWPAFPLNLAIPQPWRGISGHSVLAPALSTIFWHFLTWVWMVPRR